MGQNSNFTSTEALSDTLGKLDLAGRLSLLSELGRNVVFTTSLGIEDQVLTSALATGAPGIRIVTLETGRLFGQTLELIEQTEARFGVLIERFRPDPGDIVEYVGKYGRNGFYDSVEARHACCAVRKLKPLARALEGADFWITGLRRGQSNGRSSVPFVSWDDNRGLLKANPLADWDKGEIETYVERHDVPINPLHGQGYPSIGCEPCTRAIEPGEPERAGRWWWEQDDKRECGLHVPAQAGAANG